MTTTKRLFDTQTQSNIDRWLNGDYDRETKQQVLALIQKDPQGAIDAFYTTLAFGTGGLRGIVGVGSNRMNRYTVMTATQGLANYLKKQCQGQLSVLIGYDSRHESPNFAHVAAQVLAGNGIRAYLYRHLRPTPLVSFGCRARHCNAAIMVTASHNPPHYNGYKVYWSDGGQVIAPHDQGIIDEVNKVTELTMITTVPLTHSLIQWIDEEIDEEYLQETDRLQLYPDMNRKEGADLHVVYSGLHGTGITLVPKILTRWGFSSLSLVKGQSEPDGDFPTVKSANPEERAALKLGIETLLETNGDLLLATDPDADRVGVAVRESGKATLLTGNQIASICLEHVCHGLTQQKRMPKDAACVKSLVTTPLFRAIAEYYGVTCFDVFPGFKYISAKIHEWENSPVGYEFLFGGEESYGYLLGTASRDKDGVISCALLCEVALQARKKGKTLVDLLDELYQHYGIHREKLLSINYPETREGRFNMQQAMHKLREDRPKQIGNASVLSSVDYLRQTPASDMLSFTLEGGCWLVIRPSGTEPKVKVYAGIANKSHRSSVQSCDERLDQLLADVKRLL